MCVVFCARSLTSLLMPDLWCLPKSFPYNVSPPSCTSCVLFSLGSTTFSEPPSFLAVLPVYSVIALLCSVKIFEEAHHLAPFPSFSADQLTSFLDRRTVYRTEPVELFSRAAVSMNRTSSFRCTSPLVLALSLCLVPSLTLFLLQ